MRTGARPRKPSLPEERGHLPREVYADVRAAAGAETEDVARALAAADAAVERGAPEEAVEVLTWAKAAASRSWAVREGLGVAHYLAGQYGEAHRELAAYRRLSGRQDQNHLLADCARATGQPERAREHVEAMLAAGVDEALVVEGLLVVAGERLDRGDAAGAMVLLERGPLDPEEPQWHHLRLWHLAARIAEAAGDADVAQRWRAAIADADEEAMRLLDG